MSAWIHDRDPSRPVHYEGDWDSGYVDVYSRMYATHAEVDLIGQRAEPTTVDPDPGRAPARTAVHPVRVRPRDG